MTRLVRFDCVLIESFPLPIYLTDKLSERQFMELRGKEAFICNFFLGAASGIYFKFESQTREVFPQSCHVVQALPCLFASFFCHSVSSLFTHTGFSVSVPMTTSLLTEDRGELA